MGVNRKHSAALLAIVGAGLIIAGTAMIFVPAALIIAGAAVGGAGLFGVDVG
jgi:hypothetical protein